MENQEFQWVSVDDRLPNPKDMDNIAVLTCRKSTFTGRSIIMAVGRWNGWEWIINGKEVATVTHWMYLPNPPITT